MSKSSRCVCLSRLERCVAAVVSTTRRQTADRWGRQPLYGGYEGLPALASGKRDALVLLGFRQMRQSNRLIRHRAALTPLTVSLRAKLRSTWAATAAAHRLIASNSGKRLYSAAPHTSFTKAAAAFASFAGPNGVDSSINWSKRPVAKTASTSLVPT